MNKLYSVIPCEFQFYMITIFHKKNFFPFSHSDCHTSEINCSGPRQTIINACRSYFLLFQQAIRSEIGQSHRDEIKLCIKYSFQFQKLIPSIVVVILENKKKNGKLNDSIYFLFFFACLIWLPLIYHSWREWRWTKKKALKRKKWVLSSWLIIYEHKNIRQ
jgi:hypothetical protein